MYLWFFSNFSFSFLLVGGGNSGWTLEPKDARLLPRFKELEDSIKEEQAHVKRLAERTQAISLMTEWGMRKREIRFKSQTLQNSPLTRIKAHNPINSMANRGGGGAWWKFFFPPASGEWRKRKKVKRKEKDGGVIKSASRDHQEH